MIHPRIQLVSADVVATIRGVTRETVYDWVDGGECPAGQGQLAGAGWDSYTWVWNVGAGRERELRFWAAEINDPRAVRNLSLASVIAALVPRRDLPGQFPGLRNWEVGELLRVSRATLVALRDELCAQPHNGCMYVPCAALREFLTRRWCFGPSSAIHPPTSVL